MKFSSPFFLKIIFLFTVTQALGIFVALKIASLPEAQDITSQTSLTWTDFLIFIIFIIVITFVASRIPRVAGYFYKIIFAFLVLSMIQLLASIWVSALLSWGIAILSLILFWTLNSVLIQDLIMILTLSGFGAVLGFALNPLSSVVLLAVFSIYDIIAVYGTKHMITMAQGMVRAGAIFGFVVPNTVEGFNSSMSNVQPGDQFMILGSGDVALPLVLTVSVSLLSIGQGVLVGVFSVLGLILMQILFTGQKVRRPMAALPPIAVMSIIGYLIASVLIR